MDRCERREADRIRRAHSIGGRRLGAVCKILYSNPGAADWPAIVHMPRSLALGSDPAHSASFFISSLKQLKAVPFSPASHDFPLGARRSQFS